MKDQSSKILPLEGNPETVHEALVDLKRADPSPTGQQPPRSESTGGNSKFNSPTEILLDHSGGAPDLVFEVVCPEEPDGTSGDPDSSLQKHDTQESEQVASLLVRNKTFRPFNERFWIGEQIGTGGMGFVHLGWDLNLQRYVAIKLIRHDRKADKQVVHRFLREARIAGRLRHPGILGIHDFYIEPTGSGYIIMDLITGKTMEQAIAESKDDESKRLSLLTTFLQICQAVSFAHASGVVHRDLKPANIMVGDYGLATVLDWGLAKVVGTKGAQNDPLEEESEGDEVLPMVLERISPSQDCFSTQFGTVMGTPYYLAPEQARGESVDYRADVFSLGGILCHLLTGSPPFVGEKILDVYQQSASGDVSRAMDQLDRCGAPTSIVLLAKQCLDPNVSNRPENASSLVRVLKAYLESGQRRAEEELVRFFDLSLDMFCIANTQGYFWKVNGNFTRTLGYTSKELTSLPFIEFVHPEDRIGTLNEVNRLSKGELTIQFRNRYLKKNGQYIWLEWNARSLKDEGIVYAVARDITERIELEEEKKRIESDRFRLSEIVESASDAIIAKDLNGVVQSWNSGAENLFESELAKSQKAFIDFAENANIPLHSVDQSGTIIWANNAELNFLGYCRHEYVGQPIAKFHADQEAISDILRLLRQGESIAHYVAKLMAKDGSIKDVAIYSSAFQENEGKFHTRCFSIELSPDR